MGRSYLVVMERVLISALFVLVLSGFVIAGSEISTNFVIDVPSEEESVVDIPSEDSFGIYGGWIIGVLIVLAVVVKIFKMKGVGKKKKKVSKKRKVSRKKKRKVSRKKKK